MSWRKERKPLVGRPVCETKEVNESKPCISRLARYELEMQEEKAADRPKRVAFGLLIAVMACILGICACQIASIWCEDSQSEQVAQTFRAYLHVPDSASQSQTTQGELTDTVRVDWDGLRALAPSAVGWIRIDGLPVDYAVMQAQDNTFYLSHSPDGSENRAGSIFMDTWNRADFTDPNTVLYGHRMNNGSMFGSLHLLAEQDFLDAHHEIRILTPTGERVYEIFCVQQIAARADAPEYRIGFAGRQDFASWTDRQREGVLSSRSAPSGEDRHFLTLSTCVKGTSESRLVVSAFLLEEKPY